MRLVVPTNWDDNLIKKLKNYPIDIVYAKLKRDSIGGGRPAVALPEINKTNAKLHIKKIHDAGFKFNYVLNSACMGNQEFLPDYQSEILKQLEWIAKQEVEYVTVTIPFLIELIKKNFPQLKIVASVFLNIDSLQKARFYQNLGVSEIVTDQSQNRNLKLLNNIKKSINLDLQIVVNNVCLLFCPYRLYHQNINSHASQINKTKSKNVSDSYVTFSCESMRINHPEEIIKSPWVRPEDLDHYEKIGIKRFKISGRTKDTDWIVKVVKAYATRKSPKNLAKILSFPIPSSAPSANIFINNSSLNNFIHKFKNKDCRYIECGKCNLCYEMSEKAVKIKPHEVKNVTQQYNKILEDFFCR